MKYKKAHYLQISRGTFKRLEGCKASTKWLYVVLNELEHKYTGKGKRDFFFKGIDDLAVDAELSRPVVIQGLRELSKLKLIKTWQAHWKDAWGRLSEKHITAIRILGTKGVRSLILLFCFRYGVQNWGQTFKIHL